MSLKRICIHFYTNNRTLLLVAGLQKFTWSNYGSNFKVSYLFQGSTFWTVERLSVYAQDSKVSIEVKSFKKLTCNKLDVMFSLEPL